MKKHLIISSYDDVHNPYYGGGGAAAIHEVAKRLARNYQVTVLTSKYPGSLDQVIDGITYQRIGLNIPYPQLCQLIFVLILPLYARKLVYDIWIESFTPPFSISLLPFTVKKPLIGLVHMLAARDMERKYHLPFIWVENFGLRFYHSIIVLTKEVSKIVRRANSQAKIYLIPNGVDRTFYNQYTRPYQGNPYILYLGRFEINQKGLDLLIKSFTKLTSDNLKLVIAGGGTTSDTKALLELVRENKLSARINILTRVKGLEKIKLLKNARMVVIPSRYETFSLTALEALAAGTPVVCFNIPGMKWIKGHAMIARRFSVTDLAGKIDKIHNNKKLHHNLSQSGYELASHYDWDQIVEKYRQIIKASL